jgi:WD40 repeat protein
VDVQRTSKTAAKPGAGLPKAVMPTMTSHATSLWRRTPLWVVAVAAVTGFILGVTLVPILQRTGALRRQDDPSPGAPTATRNGIVTPLTTIVKGRAVVLKESRQIQLQAASSIDFSADGRLAVTGGADGYVRIWDVDGGRQTQQFKGHEGVVFGVRWTPDGTQVLSWGATERALRLWDVKSGARVRQWDPITTKGFELSARVAADNARVMCVHYRGIWIWDIKTGSLIDTLGLNKEQDLNDAVFLPDGKRVLSSARNSGLVRLWDTEKKQEIVRFEGHTGQVSALNTSRDGTRAVSGGKDGRVRVWSLAARAETGRFETGAEPVLSVSLSENGRLAAAAAGQVVVLWDVDSRTQYQRLEHPAMVYDIALSRDGRRLLARTGTALFVWEIPATN